MSSRRLRVDNLCSPRSKVDITTDVMGLASMAGRVLRLIADKYGFALFK